jgi:hypothetical protein
MQEKIPERKFSEKITHYFARNKEYFVKAYREGKTYEGIGEMLRDLFPNYSLARDTIHKQFGPLLSKEDRLARAIFDINKKSDGKTLIAPSSRLLRNASQSDYRTDSQITNN